MDKTPEDRYLDQLRRGPFTEGDLAATRGRLHARRLKLMALAGLLPLAFFAAVVVRVWAA